VKIQIDMVVYRIMWLSGLCVGVSWVCHRLNQDLPTLRPLNQHYMINHHIDLYFHVTQTDPEGP
jgi:hypothetical protein